VKRKPEIPNFQDIQQRKNYSPLANDLSFILKKQQSKSKKNSYERYQDR
jgi:hypothetical protein